ncbi:MAG: signal recognition particle protein [Phycisphaeraceae bacterium]|nr:MAG: signal recognition particle protein [Phycisphaeraceae bacterium]
MFDRLSDGFNGVFRKLSGQSAISEANVREAMDEVRTALLEADVQYDVVETFCERVMADALGQEVTKSLKPGQEMIGIVNRRLVELLGGDPDVDPQEAMMQSGPGILKMSPGPTVIMMCGLQGSGKTTTCGKLAAMLKKQGRTVMLCAADLQRPAAVEQLETVAGQANELPGGAQVRFYGEADQVGAYGERVGVAVDVCKRALKAARDAGVDVLILDTAGRLHINDDLMGELHAVHKTLKPHHIFLVVDAMTGQDAVKSAKAFHERLEVDGVILTKFDSDTRGGAAISVKHVTGAPIRYIGTGEKLDAIEPFHAERMAGRILGMGDVVSLVEKAQEEVSEEEAEKLQAKMAKGELTMDDFLKQMKALRRMGPMKQIMGMLPGVGSMLKDIDIDEKQLDRTEAMVQSMTTEERAKPELIKGKRQKRIAQGSGNEQPQVGQLVKQFGVINKMTKQMSGMSGASRVAAAKQLAGGGMGGMMSGMPSMPGLSTKGTTKSGSRGVKKRKPKRR